MMDGSIIFSNSENNFIKFNKIKSTHPNDINL